MAKYRRCFLSLVMCCGLVLQVTLGTRVLAAENEWLVDLYDLKIPDGPVPHPAVVVVPGCDGFGNTWVESTTNALLADLLAAGLATIRADYVNASEYPKCRLKGEELISKDQIASDIAQTVNRVIEDKSIKRTAVNIIGWSDGAGGALHYLATKGPSSPITVASVVAYYPNCQGVKTWGTATPALVFFAGKDEVVSPEICRQLFLAEAAVGIEQEVFPNAYHAFDMAKLPEKFQPFAYFDAKTVGCDPKAAAAARKRLMSFLRR